MQPKVSSCENLDSLRLGITQTSMKTVDYEAVDYVSAASEMIKFTLYSCCERMG